MRYSLFKSKLYIFKEYISLLTQYGCKGKINIIFLGYLLQHLYGHKIGKSFIKGWISLSFPLAISVFKINILIIKYLSFVPKMFFSLVSPSKNQGY